MSDEFSSAQGCLKSLTSTVSARTICLAPWTRLRNGWDQSRDVLLCYHLQLSHPTLDVSCGSHCSSLERRRQKTTSAFCVTHRLFWSAHRIPQRANCRPLKGTLLPLFTPDARNASANWLTANLARTIRSSCLIRYFFATPKCEHLCRGNKKASQATRNRRDKRTNTRAYAHPASRTGMQWRQKLNKGMML